MRRSKYLNNTKNQFTNFVAYIMAHAKCHVCYTLLEIPLYFLSLHLVGWPSNKIHGFYAKLVKN